VTSPRRQTLAGRLARLGFADTGRAERLLTGAGHQIDDALIDAVGATADPDLALTGLLGLLEAGGSDEIIAELRSDTGARDRLLGVLGVSAAFGDQLGRHPGHWRVLTGPAATTRPDPGQLRATLLRAVGADPEDPAPQASMPDAAIALRLAYRKALLHLAGRDLTRVLTVEEVAAELADLAAAALEAGLAIARTEVGEDAGTCRLAVIGMGKCGGRELNYVSDVDVVFVAEPTNLSNDSERSESLETLGSSARDGSARDGSAEGKALRTATRLAAAMMRACSATTSEGTLWEVDAALRPEGKSGPLVRTLASHRAYYERWAKTWEFQALLKARPVAGDRELGEAYVETLAPLVWHASEREHFVEDVQAMRRRVEARIDPDEADRQLKLGPGGLRDVEFAVQLLQLVHGRADEDLRGPNTLVALNKLSWGGYVGRGDAATLGAAYRFLRRVEHLIQLYRLRRTHLVPDDPAGLRRLGRALGFRADPVGDFTAEWHRHAREVRRLHEKLFYRPLLSAVARLPEDETRLTRAAAQVRLVALGYVDPEGALRHIQALTSGVSRRAAIQRTLLPVMLGWFADGPDPDAGLLGFRKVSDALGTTPWYLRLLRDEVTVAERMAWVLSASRYATDLLLRAPEAVAMLANVPDRRSVSDLAVGASEGAVADRRSAGSEGPAVLGSLADVSERGSAGEVPGAAGGPADITGRDFADDVGLGASRAVANAADGSGSRSAGEAALGASGASGSLADASGRPVTDAPPGADRVSEDAPGPPIAADVPGRGLAGDVAPGAEVANVAGVPRRGAGGDGARGAPEGGAGAAEGLADVSGLGAAASTPETAARRAGVADERSGVDAPSPGPGTAGMRAGVSDGRSAGVAPSRGPETAAMLAGVADERSVGGVVRREPGVVAGDSVLATRAYRGRAALMTEALAAVGRYDSPELAAIAIRGLRRRELFGVAAADLLGGADVATVGLALTDIAVVTIEAALAAATAHIELERRGPLPTRLAIVAMGRFGGHELGYGSDADVMFVHDPLPGADERDASGAAHAVAEELRRLLALPAPDPPLVIDPGLRPEGRQGPLVRTLDSYAAYYRRWSAPWESQALLRADPSIGDRELGRRFGELIDPIRRPEGGIDEVAVREIRRLKARMEAERLPRGADPTTHVKLGPGGLTDVEWVVQLLQLQHVHELPELATTETLVALAAAVRGGLLGGTDAEVLAEVWQLATRIRNAVMLVRGRASDSIPSDLAERTAVARVLGYDGAGDLLEDYRRSARRARTVVEEAFYGGR
jgi:glutamine synthetase adenylyltransferase